MFANISNAGGSALGDYTARILAEYARRSGNGGNGTQGNGNPFYTADEMQARYLEVFGGSAGGSGRKYSDADRKNRLADYERRKRAKNLIQSAKDEPRFERFWEKKAAADRQLPAINQPTDALSDTAHHEAAHGVVQVLEEADAGYLTVVPDANSLGRMVSGRRSCSSRDGRIRMTMAGPLASAKFQGSHWVPGNSDRGFGDGGDSDDGDLRYVERFYSRNSTEFHALRQQTEKLLDKNWHLVSLVADLLLEHHTILGSELAALVAENQKPLLAA